MSISPLILSSVLKRIIKTSHVGTAKSCLHKVIFMRRKVKMVETESVNASSMDVVSRGFMNFKIGVFERMLMLFVFVKHS